MLGMGSRVTWAGLLLGCILTGLPGSWWSASGMSLGLGYCSGALLSSQDKKGAKQQFSFWLLLHAGIISGFLLCSQDDTVLLKHPV